MIDNFIPIGEARALKELGYKELVFAAYDGCDMLCSHKNVFKPINYNTGGSTYTSAPTYSQALQWFTSVHRLHGFITLEESGYGSYRYEIYKCVPPTSGWTWCANSRKYLTEEETLLHMLNTLISLAVK